MLREIETPVCYTHSGKEMPSKRPEKERQADNEDARKFSAKARIDSSLYSLEGYMLWLLKLREAGKRKRRYS